MSFFQLHSLIFLPFNYNSSTLSHIQFIVCAPRFSLTLFFLFFNCKCLCFGEHQLKINSNEHFSDQLFTGVFHISVDTSARAVFYSWSPNDLKEDQEGPKVMGPRTLITPILYSLFSDLL